MAKTLDREDVVALMKKRQGNRTNREFAKELGISEQFLGDVYFGRRDPGDKLLEALGLEKETVYRKESDNAAD